MNKCVFSSEVVAHVYEGDLCLRFRSRLWNRNEKFLVHLDIVDGDTGFTLPKQWFINTQQSILNSYAIKSYSIDSNTGKKLLAIQNSDGKIFLLEKNILVQMGRKFYYALLTLGSRNYWVYDGKYFQDEDQEYIIEGIDKERILIKNISSQETFSINSKVETVKPSTPKRVDRPYFLDVIKGKLEIFFLSWALIGTEKLLIKLLIIDRNTGFYWILSEWLKRPIETNDWKVLNKYKVIGIDKHVRKKKNVLILHDENGMPISIEQYHSKPLDDDFFYGQICKGNKGIWVYNGKKIKMDGEEFIVCQLNDSSFQLKKEKTKTVLNFSIF